MLNSIQSFRKEPKLITQLLFVAATAIVLIIFFHNYQINLENRRIQTGYDFLSDTAGFAISQTLIEYDESSSYFRVYLVGLVNTALVAILSIILATIIGLMIALSRLSDNWLLRKIGYWYVELFRNVPPLLHILFWYQVLFLRILPDSKNPLVFLDSIYLSVRGITLPEVDWNPGGAPFIVIGAILTLIIVVGISVYGNYQVKQGIYKKNWVRQLIVFLIFCVSLFIFPPFEWVFPEVGRFGFTNGIVITPELIAIVAALSSYTAVYIGEAIRSSIEAVPKGQSESARSLGLSRAQYMRLVILPQALRTVIPPVISQYLNILKNSSLGVVIAYPDLVSVFSGTALNQVGRALEIITMTMLTYLAFSLSISLFMNGYNHYLQKRGGA